MGKVDKEPGALRGALWMGCGILVLHSALQAVGHCCPVLSFAGTNPTPQSTECLEELSRGCPGSQQHAITLSRCLAQCRFPDPRVSSPH